MAADDVGIDRFRGALLGLACGDALGTTLEFRPPGSFLPVPDMVGGGPFGLRPGQWTDDTSMALCLAESLLECRGFDPVDQLQRYARWWRYGHLSSTGRCFDIGTQTRAALAAFERAPWPEPAAPDPDRAGNGSIMRLAPVPLFFAADIRGAIEYSGRSSRTTHPAPRCVDACRYLGALIAGASAGWAKAELLDGGYWSRADRGDQGRWGELHPEIAEVAGGSFERKDPPAIQPWFRVNRDGSHDEL